jgi:anti-sigma B factor antagonist
MAEDSCEDRGTIRGVRRQGQVVILDLAGEIDMKCVVDLRGEIMSILQEASQVLVVNMAQVTFMDSSGVATLVEALQWCRRHKQKLKLVSLQQRVRSIFEISRLESIFDIYDSEEKALA